jgi:tetratricopeptide (TPR) repeat protein
MEYVLSQGQDDAGILKKTGLTYLKNNLPGKAVPPFSNATGLDPSDASYLAMLGVANFSGGSEQTGLEQIAKAFSFLKIDRDSLRPLIDQMLENLLANNSLELFTQKVGDSQNSGQALLLGSAYLNLGQTDRAQKVLEDALGSTNYPRSHHLLLAKCYRLAGDFASEIKTLKAQLLLWADDPQIRARLFIAYVNAGQIDFALDSLENILPLPRYAMISPLYNFGSMSKSRNLPQLLDLEDNDAVDFLLAAARAYQTTGHPDEVITYLKLAIEKTNNTQLKATAKAQITQWETIRNKQKESAPKWPSISNE